MYLGSSVGIFFLESCMWTIAAVSEQLGYMPVTLVARFWRYFFFDFSHCTYSFWFVFRLQSL
jgi:hypothetical protein